MESLPVFLFVLRFRGSSHILVDVFHKFLVPLHQEHSHVVGLVGFKYLRREVIDPVHHQMNLYHRQERRDAQAVGIAHDEERPVVAGIGAVLLHDVLVGGQLVHQLGGDLRPETAHVVQRVIA